jgi:hypothetical protein
MRRTNALLITSIIVHIAKGDKGKNMEGKMGGNKRTVS